MIRALRRIIEVVSPSESVIGLNRKVAEYLAAGSHEVCVLDAENREIFIRTPDGARILRATDVLESPSYPVSRFASWTRLSHLS